MLQQNNEKKTTKKLQIHFNFIFRDNFAANINRYPTFKIKKTAHRDTFSKADEN